MNEYRSAGYSGKFIGTDVHTTYIGLIDDADLWDEINGMLFVLPNRWWNEEGTLIDLINQIVYEYHSPEEAEHFINSGSAYLAAHQIYQMLEIIREAVGSVGPESFNSQALYEAATAFTLDIDGVDRYSFDETKRTSTDYVGIYEANAAEEDLLRVDPEWLPIPCIDTGD